MVSRMGVLMLGHSKHRGSHAIHISSRAGQAHIIHLNLTPESGWIDRAFPITGSVSEQETKSALLTPNLSKNEKRVAKGLGGSAPHRMGIEQT